MISTALTDRRAVGVKSDLPPGMVILDKLSSLEQRYQDQKVSAICIEANKRIAASTLTQLGNFFIGKKTFGDRILGVNSPSLIPDPETDKRASEVVLELLDETGFSSNEARQQAAIDIARDIQKITAIVQSLCPDRNVYSILASNWVKNSKPHTDGKISAVVTYVSIPDESRQGYTSTEQSKQHFTTLCYGAESIVGASPKVKPFGGIQLGDLVIMKPDFVHGARKIPSELTKNKDGVPHLVRISLLVTTD